jgi:hypothetical protein
MLSNRCISASFIKKHDAFPIGRVAARAYISIGGNGGGGHHGGGGIMRRVGDHGDSDGSGSFEGGLAASVLAACVIMSATTICLPANASPPVSVNQVAELAKQLKAVEKIWNKAAGGDGQLNLNECLTLFKSPDMLAAVKKMAKGAEVALPSDASIKSLFRKADKDGSKKLNKIEFLGLFLGVFAEVIVANPLVLANVLVDSIDKDRNGKLEGREIKALLSMVGIPSVALMLVPDEQAIDFKSILGVVAKKC